MLRKSSALALALVFLVNIMTASGVYAQTTPPPEEDPVVNVEVNPEDVVPEEERPLVEPGQQTREEDTTYEELTVEEVVFGGINSGMSGDELSAVATTGPPPLGKATDPRYFLYNDQTIVVVGVSGSYLPHVKRDRPRDYSQPNPPINPALYNCTYDQIGTRSNGTPIYKYQQCVDKLKLAGVNHLKIWVALNHSVGKLFIERGTGAAGQDPYPNEQPFVRAEVNTTTHEKRWLLDSFDDTFFTNLYNVVKYCQDNDVIVGVTLFDPWSGWVGNQPSNGPWYAGNNKANGYANGIGFTDPALFIKAENPSANPDTSEIDTQTQNKVMREYQVKLMQRTVTALTTLNNFYWELANEPDGKKAYGLPLINWHKYMARKLYAMEPANRHHLIAVNLSTREAIDGVDKYSKIDIINGHYVFMKGPLSLPGGGSIPEIDRFGAITLLRTYNAYNNAGAPTADNTKRWGFNEGRYGGVPDDSDYHDDVTGPSARVEAWENMINGSAIFDHLTYRWANNNSGDNNINADEARRFLGYLRKFMTSFSLSGMKRMMPAVASRWINNPPAYGSPYWAAMSNGSTYLFYAHRSGLSPHGFAKYDPFTGASFTTVSFTVQNLNGAGNYKAEWYNPDGTMTNGSGGVANGVLKPVTSVTFYWHPTTNPTKLLTSPPYKQDIVLKITKL